MSSTPPVSTKRSFFSRNSSRSATPQPDQTAQLAKQLDGTSLEGDGAGDDDATPLEGLDDVAAELQGTDTDSESGQSSCRNYAVATSAHPATSAELLLFAALSFKIAQIG